MAVNLNAARGGTLFDMLKSMLPTVVGATAGSMVGGPAGAAGGAQLGAKLGATAIGSGITDYLVKAAQPAPATQGVNMNVPRSPNLAESLGQAGVSTAVRAGGDKLMGSDWWEENITDRFPKKDNPKLDEINKQIEEQSGDLGELIYGDRLPSHSISPLERLQAPTTEAASLFPSGERKAPATEADSFWKKIKTWGDPTSTSDENALEALTHFIYNKEDRDRIKRATPFRRI